MFDDVLSIHAPTLAAIQEVLELQRRGVTFSSAEAQARAGLTPRTPSPAPGSSIAVIPLMGLLTRRGGGFLSFLFGGTSLSRFSEAVRAASLDRDVATILIHVDSPGGEVSGTPEAADAVFAARQRKRVVAVADGLMASAAFWIGVQAHEIVASSSSTVGSIGVLAVHSDVSRAEEAGGRRHTIITSARFKGEGNELEPLGDDARAQIQRRVDEAGAMFTAAVARGRRVPVAMVRGPQFGEGRAFFAAEAVRRGLADRVGTVEAVIAREVARTQGATDFDAALGWHLELLAHGIPTERPRPPRDELQALDRIRLAELGF